LSDPRVCAADFDSHFDSAWGVALEVSATVRPNGVISKSAGRSAVAVY
jgi:hypothetical protein